ncbi:hypothetical protein JHK85_016447 [Glycine max]|nr:hypothetical protein JHK85_016447 [Glycine max]
MDKFSSRVHKKSALLTWQHIASFPPSLPVVYLENSTRKRNQQLDAFFLELVNCERKRSNSERDLELELYRNGNSGGGA